MNLSKTEKLIAARKKLKEFQRKKKIHTQGDSSIDGNGIAKLSQQNEIIEQSSLKCRSTNDRNVPAEEALQNFTVPIECNDPHVNREITKSACINDTTNAGGVDITDVPKQVDIEPTNTMLSFEDDNNHVQQAVVEYNENNAYCSTIPFCKEIDKRENDPRSYVQTEHSLQTEEAVVNDSNVSMDNNDRKILDSDLQRQNQGVTCLQDQNEIVNHLQVQVRQYSNKISELQAALADKDREIEAKLMQETRQLKEQLQSHMQTTSILILEKEELTTALSKNEAIIKRNMEEIEELSGKLKYAQTRSSEFEKELNIAKNDAEEARKAVQLVKQDYGTIYGKHLELEKEKEDLMLQVSELKQKLSVKNTELSTLQQSFQEKSALLSLSELKIQQLTNTSQELEMLDDQHRNASMLEQQLAETKEALKKINEENEEASKQYQNYVRQLEAKEETLLRELERQKQLNNELEIREKNYVERLSGIEQELQVEKSKVENLLPLENEKHRTNSLLTEIDELTLEQERLHIVISEKDSHIEILRKELQELQDKENENTNVSKLVQALESEQLGASRAVSQNQQLKRQLNEMHEAFISLSNARLDLTEQLQSERAIGRKLNAELNKVESEVDYLKNCLKEKEASLTELEKENLQNAQIADQIHHYQAQSHYTHTLQQELEKALTAIEDLKTENEKLIEELNRSRTEKEKNETNEFNSDASNEISKNNNESIDKKTHDTTEIETISRSTITDPSDSLDPVKKLEERFKDTMERLADLTDEKQRLEHLVLQLQGETETIGEYIALYQRQRAILQERAKQKDETFRQLVEQKNEQQEQLHKLKVLVTNLIKRKSVADTTELTSYILDREGENKKDVGSFEKDERNDNVVREILDDETTSQILDLLTEIKDCKDSCMPTSNFHPCPWCSGKLITV